MWNGTKINDLKYKINEDIDYLKSYYRKAFISYFESKNSKDIEEARNYNPKKLEGFIKDLTENHIEINNPVLFFEIVQTKRYDTLKLPKLPTKDGSKKITEKELFSKIDEFYKKEYLKVKKIF